LSTDLVEQSRGCGHLDAVFVDGTAHAWFLRVTYDSIMATVKQVERRIEKIEGFRVQILHGRDRRDVRSDKGGVTQYPYERALKGSTHVKAWRDHRFAKHYPGFEVQVLDASGHVAHGGTLLTTVRDSYLDG
jgi:hypothetical protein